MSSPPPKGWKEQVNQGLGEGAVVGETKSRYYMMLLAVDKEAGNRHVSFTSLMMDILEDWAKQNKVQFEEP